MGVFVILGLVFLAIFGVVFVVGLIWLLVSHMQAESDRRRQGLRAAAQRYGGRLQESFWSGTSMRFELDGVPAELTYFGGTDKAPPWTKVHFQWSAPGSLRLAPEGTWGRLKKYLGTQDIQIGNVAFDDAFLIQGHPESWVREALSPKTRQHLGVLYGLGATSGFFGRGKGLTLDVTPAGVVFKCLRNHVRNPDDLMTFLDRSTQVFRALKAMSGGGVAISVAEVVQAGKCPVCSDAAGELSKRCRGCNTAYHPECWDYLGGCAIFGCEDRYRQQEPRARGW